MRTAEGPMAELEAFAAGLEAADPELLDVSTFGGFTYGDTLSAGATAMVWHARDASRAAAVAGRHAAQMKARLERCFIRLPTPAEGISQALASGKFPVAVTDPGDNAGSGGIGDTPGLLRALLEADVDVPTVFAYITDPGLVERAQQVGIGGELAGTLGAPLTPIYGAAVPFNGTVLALTEGKYRNTGPMMRGVMSNFGPTAMLSLAGTPGGRNVRVIVTTYSRSPHDPGLLALHGVALDDVKPVSYTHLDVYKRQDQHVADRQVSGRTGPPRGGQDGAGHTADRAGGKGWLHAPIIAWPRRERKGG